MHLKDFDCTYLTTYVVKIKTQAIGRIPPSPSTSQAADAPVCVKFE